MRLELGWRATSDNLRPTSVDKDGVSLLSNFLMDHGGGDYLHSLPWIDECLRHVETVKRGEAKSLESARDAWAVLLRADGARIYSLFDETYSELIHLDAFESALRAWRDFLQTPPDVHTTRIVVV